ncbi:hypothetical protein ES702_01715 [subsurface metagenome]
MAWKIEAGLRLDYHYVFPLFWGYSIPIEIPSEFPSGEPGPSLPWKIRTALAVRIKFEHMQGVIMEREAARKALQAFLDTYSLATAHLGIFYALYEPLFNRLTVELVAYPGLVMGDIIENIADKAHANGLGYCPVLPETVDVAHVCPDEPTAIPIGYEILIAYITEEKKLDILIGLGLAGLFSSGLIYGMAKRKV